MVEERGLRIRPDDPLWQEPAPLPVGKLKPRKIDDAYDQMEKTFFRQGDPPEGGPPPAMGVNTLGEVPDSAWYTNRHAQNRRMSLAELVRGPGEGRPPENGGDWTILSAKSEGVTPGFVIQDSAGRRYLLKFDARRAPNSTTGVDAIGARIFHALGYYTPENYIVSFSREQLRVGDKAQITDITGAKRRMTDYDVDKLLQDVHRVNGHYRALASLFISGEILGPWLYAGTRSDDPNDIYPHQHRRDVRGLYVFAAWLNHYDATSINTLDSIVGEGGVRHVRHHLIDFGSILGSSGVGARDPRNGYVYQYDFAYGWKSALSLGLYTPKWHRVDYAELPEAGRFEAEAFDPRDWKPIYPNPAFLNRRPDDTYWAAKKVMAFTDSEIRALVETGRFDDPRTVEHLAATLIARRDKIGRTFFSDVLPLEEFRVEGDRLSYEDLAVHYGFRGPLKVAVQWHRYAAGGGRGEPVGEGLVLPAELKTIRAGELAVASLQAGARGVDVYLRKTRAGGYEAAGIQRW